MVCFHAYISWSLCYFFFNDTATTEIYTLSLHDALPICPGSTCYHHPTFILEAVKHQLNSSLFTRSEEHTSELQSLRHLVCRLLLEKKSTHPSSAPAGFLPPSPGDVRLPRSDHASEHPAE